jgi:site-specific DNA-methyltransferase (adenine-specific)
MSKSLTSLKLKNSIKAAVTAPVPAAPRIALYEEPVQTPTSSSKKTRRTPCPKGDIRNKKTGLCEKNTRKSKSTVTASKNVISQTPIINEQQTVFIEPPPVINEQQTVFNEQQTVINEINNDDPCVEYNNLLNKRKLLNKDISTKNSDCEDVKYKKIQKYFNLESDDKKSNQDLLNALQHFYIESKTNDPNYLLTFHEFIRMFPRDTMKTLKFKRQHVFEAICKLLLLLDYDEGEIGYNKRIYSSLEELKKNPNLLPLSKSDILYQSINESSKSGVVDILFETDYIESKENCFDDWKCDCVDNIKSSLSEQITSEQITSEQITVTEETLVGGIGSNDNLPKKSKLILIQNKYFEIEKSNNKDEYDVSKIYTASNSLNSLNVNMDKQIILMVNNKQALDSKITRSQELINAIYGVKELEDWFRKLLNDLYQTKTIEEFTTNKLGQHKSSPDLKPKFHQSLFTNSTLQYKEKEGYKLFIWGAVPRSGKSYMIGDLISKNKSRLPLEQDNDIVIILGAKTETECQFVKIFANFSNFDEYGIIVASANINDTCKGLKRKIDKKEKKKNIYIFSQEWFKMGKIDYNTKQFNTTSVITRFPNLFNKKRIDLYFDEIHKGGSTDKAESILYAFNNAGVKIDIFVMVTATFAKPNLRYNATDFIDTNLKNSKTIEWSYEDQQNMKQINNESKKELMINSRKKMVDNDELKDTIESLEIESIFEKYKNEYSVDTYLDIIAKEYEKHPELVLVQPALINTEFNDVDVDSRPIFINNLQCNACKTEQTKEQLTNPDNIFADPASVMDLLNFIAGQSAGPVIDTKSVYSYLQRIGAPTNRIKKHSELWFLPDKNLYLNPQLCKDVCKLVDVELNNDEESVDKKGLPNIEPLTRGLAFLLMKHTYFQNAYHVLIVQNTKSEYINSDGNKWRTSDIFPENGQIHTTINDDNLSDSIKSAERKAFSQNKSLIILTGAKLRLGISLPCADIAFNFDNIKSIDNNYQTMFRVLTERVNREKPYGYYVDFNKGRAIQFLYDYNNTYGKGKQSRDIKTKTEALQGLMLMFNYNGIGLNKLDTTKHLKLYNALINDLKLDEVSYKIHLSKMSTIQSLIKKSIGNLSAKTLQEFKSLVVLNKPEKKADKLKKLLEKGTSMLSRKGPQEEEEEEKSEEESEGESESESEEEEEEPLDEMSLLQNTLVELLPSIIALLALFSDESNYNCATLSNCVESCKLDITRLESVLCSCEKNQSIFACYMNPFYENVAPYTKEKLIELLEMINRILAERENEQLLINLNLIFNTIRDTMGKNTDSLILTMNAEDIQKKIEEYLPIRKKEKDDLGEVFTPATLIEEMLDILPKSVWSNPDLKWLDPANGIGNFPMLVYPRLLKGLEAKIPNKTSRSNHILTKMLYMVEINPKNVKISRKIFGPNANIACADFLNETDKWKKEFKGVDKFDVIIGNPPYNLKNEKETSASPLYSLFIEQSLKMTGILLFIIPSRWFVGGKGLDKFRKDMLNRTDIKLIKHFPNSEDIWKKLDISGGICYFLIDKSYNGLTNFNGVDIKINRYDKLIQNVHGYSLIEKIINYPKLSDLYLSTSYFGITTNSTYFTDDKSLVKCYVSKQKGEFKYVNSSHIKSEYNFWKVFTPQGNGNNPHFGNLIIGTPKEIASQTYFTFKVKSNDEAKSLVSYLNSKFANFMLSLRKIDQHISEDTIRWIPLPPLNKNWTDNEIYNYYKLTNSEIKTINSNDKISNNKISNDKISNDNTLISSPPKPKEPSPKSATKKKVPVKKSGRKLSIKESTKPKGGSKKNKTKKQRRVKLPQKTIRRRR